MSGMRFVGAIGAIAASLIGARAALARPLVTPMLTATSNQNLECRAVYVGPSEALITAELVSWTGSVVDSSTCLSSPGEEICEAEGPSGVPYSVGYCRFSGASPKRLRGAIIVNGFLSDPIAAALPAE